MATTATETIELSIVIPAFKESAKIERDIRAAADFLTKNRIDGEIIVVDDGSPDDTTACAMALQSSVENLRVLSYEPNRGKGHALHYGMTRARGRIIMFADAGLCVPYDIGLIGMTMLDLGMCDIAHGSRRMRGSIKRAQPLYRKIGSKGFSLLIHAFMGIPGYISDTNCGFKFYRRDVAHKLYGEMFTDGFMYDVELVLRARAENYTILEFPVLWSNDPDTRFSPSRGSLKLLRELAVIRWRLLLGKPQMKRASVTERGAATSSGT